MIGLYKQNGMDLLGKNTQKCKMCSAPIAWLKTPNGKPMPIDMDIPRLSLIVLEEGYVETAWVYRSHFETCVSKKKEQKEMFKGVIVGEKNTKEADEIQRRDSSKALHARFAGICDKFKGHEGEDIIPYIDTQRRIHTLGYFLAKVEPKSKKIGLMSQWGLVPLRILKALHRVLDRMEGAENAQGALAQLAECEKLVNLPKQTNTGEE